MLRIILRRFLLITRTKVFIPAPLQETNHLFTNFSSLALLIAIRTNAWGHASSMFISLAHIVAPVRVLVLLHLSTFIKNRVVP